MSDKILYNLFSLATVYKWLHIVGDYKVKRFEWQSLPKPA